MNKPAALAALGPICTMMVALVLVAQPVAAQSVAGTSAWSAPEQIPGYAERTQPPILVADQDRTIHAFSSQPVGSDMVVTYRTWRLDEGWSPTTDILLSPLSQQALVQGAYLDANGMMHVTFYGGNEQGANLYYAQAVAIDAGSSQAWSVPVIIANDVHADSKLAGDSKGNLVVIYSGRSDGNGLYATYSSDGGTSWSKPIVVWRAGEDEGYPDGIDLQVDEDGRWHGVWGINGIPANQMRIFHASLDSQLNHWSEPDVLASTTGERDTFAALPTILPRTGELILGYQQYATDGTMLKWFRQSLDGGETWSAPVAPFTDPRLFGGNGSPVLLTDSAGTLHAVLANRTGDCCHGMWHNIWLGDHFGSTQEIVVGPKSEIFDPTIPTAAISQGNVILATWISEGGLTGVWSSFATVDVPELPRKALPAVLPNSETLVAPATVAVLDTPTPVPTPVEVSNAPLGSAMSSNLAVLLGTAAALIVVLSVFVRRAADNRRR